MTPAYLEPPPGWPQRRRTGLPFPPGQDDQEFEVVLDRIPGESGWTRFELNLATGEVYLETDDGWTAPGWMELPRMVRRRVWHAYESRGA